MVVLMAVFFCISAGGGGRVSGDASIVSVFAGCCSNGGTDGCIVSVQAAGMM